MGTIHLKPVLVAATSSWRVISKTEKQYDTAFFFKTIFRRKGIGPMFAPAEFIVGSFYTQLY